MRPVMPLERSRATQADVSLMDQGCGLQRVFAPFKAHLARSHLVQLAVDQLHQPGRGICVPGAPIEQQARNCVRILGHRCRFQEASSFAAESPRPHRVVTNP